MFDVYLPHNWLRPPTRNLHRTTNVPPELLCEPLAFLARVRPRSSPTNFAGPAPTQKLDAHIVVRKFFRNGLPGGSLRASV